MDPCPLPPRNSPERLAAAASTPSLGSLELSGSEPQVSRDPNIRAPGSSGPLGSGLQGSTDPGATKKRKQRSAASSRGGGWKLPRDVEVPQLSGVLQVANAARLGLPTKRLQGAQPGKAKRRPATAGAARCGGVTRAKARGSVNTKTASWQTSFQQRARLAVSRSSVNSKNPLEIATQKAKNASLRVPFRDAGYLNPPSPEVEAAQGSVEKSAAEYYPDPFLSSPAHSPNALSALERQHQRWQEPGPDPRPELMTEWRDGPPPVPSEPQRTIHPPSDLPMPGRKHKRVLVQPDPYYDYPK